MYYILINIFGTRRRLLILMWIIITSSVLFSINSLFYFSGMLGHSLTTRLGIGLATFKTNKIAWVTVFASLLALQGLLLVQRIYPKILLFLSFCITPLTSFMTQTRRTLIALFVSIIILFSNRKKFLIATIVLASILVITLTPLKNRFTADTVLHNERISTNLVTWEIIKDYPVFGIGFGMQTYGNTYFLRPYYERVPAQYRHEILLQDPHNMFFDTAVRTGIIGLGLFFNVIVNFFRMGWKIA